MEPRRTANISRLKRWGAGSWTKTREENMRLPCKLLNHNKVKSCWEKYHKGWVAGTMPDRCLLTKKPCSPNGNMAKKGCAPRDCDSNPPSCCMPSDLLTSSMHPAQKETRAPATFSCRMSRCRTDDLKTEPEELSFWPRLRPLRTISPRSCTRESRSPPRTYNKIWLCGQAALRLSGARGKQTTSKPLEKVILAIPSSWKFAAPPPRAQTTTHLRPAACTGGRANSWMHRPRRLRF